MALTTSVLDAFDRANSGSLGSAWSDLFGLGTRWGIASNLAAPQSVQAADYWNAATYTDAEAFATITTKPANSTGSFSLFLRAANVGSTSTLDGYAITIYPLTGTDLIRVLRLDNGAPTTLGADISQEITAGDVLGAQIIGSTIYVYLNGTEIASRTDSTYSAAGYIGMVSAETTTRINDFGGGAYIPPSVRTHRQTLMGVR